MGSGAMGVPNAATPIPEVSGTGPNSSKRPGALTAAGVFFKIQGVLSALGAIGTFAGLVYAIAEGTTSGVGVGLLAIVAAFFGVFSYGQFVAGQRLFDRDPEGRSLGMFFSGLGSLPLLGGLMSGDTVSLIAGTINLTVFCYLWKTDDLGR